MASAEIITIGTEILLGEIVDTNTRHLARTLRNLGIDLYRTVTIGDNEDRIASAVRESVTRNEIVITTGGLGPTVDDPTRNAIAKALDTESEFREDLWQQVVEAVGRYGRQPAPNQRRQAMVPKGAIGIKNPVGTAPAFIMETQRGVVVALPGVPNEMEHILHESIIPYLQRRFELRHLIKVRVLHCAGLGEGTIDEKIGDLEMMTNPTVGLAAHTGVVDVRIAAKAETEDRATELIAGAEKEVRDRLGMAVFGADEDRLELVAMEAVSRRGWTLVALERELHGQLAERIPWTVTLPDERNADLLETARRVRGERGVDVVLGISACERDRTAEIVLISPVDERRRQISYGGPTRSLSKWAANLGLNWLRTRMQDGD
jgi:nicotinamide-nucleotide amidase